MYVCICKAVKQSQIHEAVANGAYSVRELSERLGVGRECGKCVPCARECLERELARVAEITAVEVSA